LARAQRITGRLFETSQPNCLKRIEQKLIIDVTLHSRRPSQILKRGQNFVNSYSVTEIQQISSEGFGHIVSRLTPPNNLTVIAIIQAAEDS
jgi:hypothetical protein